MAISRLQPSWLAPALLVAFWAPQALAQAAPSPSASAPPLTHSATAPPPVEAPPPLESPAPEPPATPPPLEAPPPAAPPLASAPPPAAPPLASAPPIAPEPPPRTKFQVQSDAYLALRFPGYIVGAVVHGGGGAYGSSLGMGNPLVTGYRFSERGGIISGLLIGGIISLLGGAAAGMPDSVDVRSSSYSRTNASGQKEVVTEETRTATYNDPEGRQRALDASQEAAKGLIAYRQQAFELDIYTRDWFGSKLGDARGYRANFLLTAYTGKRLIFEAGFGFGSVSAIVPGKDVVVDEAYIGIPLRLLVPWGPFYAQASFDLNFRGLDFGLLADDEIEMRTIEGRAMRVDPVRPMPLAISVHAMLWRFAASVGVETARPWTGQFGYVASLGARF